MAYYITPKPADIKIDLGYDIGHARVAYPARAIPKDKLERLVIEKLKSRVLTDDNLEELVKLVNEELRSASLELKERLDI